MKNTYTKEFKISIVKKYLAGYGLVNLTREYNISQYSIYKWTKLYESGERDFIEKCGKASLKDGVVKGKTKTIDKSKMTDKEIIAYQEMEIAILKKTCEVEALIGLNKHNIYVVIKDLSSLFPVTQLCTYLNASTSSYYYHINNTNDRDIKIKELILKIHSNRVSSGYRTIKRILLRKYNLKVNFKRILRIMKILNIKGKQKRSNYEKFDKALKVSKIFPNILNRDFKASKPN